MNLSKKTWLVISGVMWLGIGVMLLMKGLRLIVACAEQTEGAAPLLNSIFSLAGSRQQGSLLLICGALFVGFIKGRTVLAKTVKRIAEKIHLHPETLIPLKQVYDKRYWIVLGVMMGLGMLFRFLSIPKDIHGFIDVAIGSALINGAMLYFRNLIAPQKA
jgi:hypothetical protein